MPDLPGLLGAGGQQPAPQAAKPDVLGILQSLDPAILQQVLAEAMVLQKMAQQPNAAPQMPPAQMMGMGMMGAGR